MLPRTHEFRLVIYDCFHLQICLFHKEEGRGEGEDGTQQLPLILVIEMVSMYKQSLKLYILEDVHPTRLHSKDLRNRESQKHHR